ncbi:hypothetical protein [Hyalangium gracile]|uniref:hypothetical protein n=1 Tax=Hyalangium gracile TaxID=394092 RepID=UPI001CCD8941|nr:hypothetical protein [Hyalangium gracile]
MKELLQRIFHDYRWFKPTRYGRAFLNGKLEPERPDIDALVAFYEEYQNITIAAKTDRDFILIYPTKPGAEYPYVGSINWTTSVKEADKPKWRAAHLRQVQEVMSLVESPLAQAGPDDDFQRKTRRLVPNADGFGQEQAITVRDFSEGLAGLYWRSFLGAPFLRLFGDRLDALPAECRQELGDEHLLIQPYELPTQAGTPEGDARERQLISLLGPEHFYDHERHLKATRRPQIGPPVH